MTNCQRCARKTQLFLCQACATDLKDLLDNMVSRTATNLITGESRPAAGWIELLEDHAHGQTRLGESARRSTERNTPLPVHLGASQLLENVRNMLSTWVRHLCESRGIEVPE
jgi:hypothetical protein